MKIISQEKIQEMFNLISERRILKTKTILDDLTNSNDLEKVIDKQCCLRCATRLKEEVKKQCQ